VAHTRTLKIAAGLAAVAALSVACSSSDGSTEYSNPSQSVEALAKADKVYAGKNGDMGTITVFGKRCFHDKNGRKEAWDKVQEAINANDPALLPKMKLQGNPVKISLLDVPGKDNCYFILKNNDSLSPTAENLLQEDAK